MAFVPVSLDLVALSAEDAMTVRRGAQGATGIPSNRIVLAASHTHPGPATMGYFNPKEEEYVRGVVSALVQAIARAVSVREPAAAGCGSGIEATLSHYRRLKARDGRVVMNWEPVPSADYPGLAAELVRLRFGCPAMFLDGAQGTMDVDGLRDRDREGRQRPGSALAAAVGETASRRAVLTDVRLRCSSVEYRIPPRKISDAEYAWADAVLARTGGRIEPVADGVGDDSKAILRD